MTSMPCMSCGSPRDQVAPVQCLHKKNHRQTMPIMTRLTGLAYGLAETAAEYEDSPGVDHEYLDRVATNLFEIADEITESNKIAARLVENIMKDRDRLIEKLNASEEALQGALRKLRNAQNY